MAILRTQAEEIELEDGAAVLDAAEALGVCFGCQAGNCGSCLTRVAAGMENLGDYSENERVFGLDDGERLMCQCMILRGQVTLEI